MNINPMVVDLSHDDNVGPTPKRSWGGRQELFVADMGLNE